jgi:hypothetical protein
MEVVFLLVQRFREEREHVRLRVMLDAQLGNSSEAVEAMNALTREVFFHEEVERRQKARDPQEILKNWLAMGAVRMDA